MKPYGVKRSDKTCCAGHSKYSKMDNESTHAPRMRPAKKSARQKAKVNYCENMVCDLNMFDFCRCPNS